MGETSGEREVSESCVASSEETFVVVWWELKLDYWHVKGGFLVFGLTWMGTWL